MTKIEELKYSISNISVEYTATKNRTIREILAQKWEEQKAELDQLLVSECCNAKILQQAARGTGEGVCEDCRQKTEPRKPKSNCCDAEIIMYDFNFHGKCKSCKENCNP